MGVDTIFGTLHHLNVAQECARAVLIFFYGLVVLRVSGRRTFARWSAIDVAISIIVGSSLSRAMSGNAPLAGTLAAVAALVLLHLSLCYLVAHSAAMSRLIEGRSEKLASDGELDSAKRRGHLISREDLEQALRAKGVEGIEQTKALYLEANGRISVIKKGHCMEECQ
ncbi:MAG: DUF421 domain-containing protein [Rhizomicrobium sp.]